MILVTGARGQLGSDVILELNRRKITCCGVGRNDFDITDANAVSQYIQSNAPLSVIHCAAYTAVDKAEEESEICYQVNVIGTENVAKACLKAGAEMIYISTDYVFNGEGEVPYEIDSRKGPKNVYGKTKLLGEEAMCNILHNYYIVRVSWVFGNNGDNFVKTILQLSQRMMEINVVADQIGSPTYTMDLAVLLCDMAMSGKYGIYHATNEGYCSRAEFAEKILQVTKSPCKINKVLSISYPTMAERPKNSRLSKRSLDEAGFSRLPGWELVLERLLVGTTL